MSHFELICTLMFDLTLDKKRVRGSVTEVNAKRLKIDNESSEASPSYYSFFDENNRLSQAKSDADKKLYHQTKMKEECLKRFVASVKIASKGTQGYKYSKFGEQWFLVPRESTIKSILQNMNDTVLKPRGLYIRGYNGAECRTHGMFCKCKGCDHRRASLPREEALIESWVVDPMDDEYKKVEMLPIFNDSIVPEMEKGHLKKAKNLSVERCLVLQPFEEEPLWEQCHPVFAAIWFSIELDTGVCEIHTLGVSDEYQRRGMGSILLSAAVFIGLEYGIKTFTLESSEEGLPLYIGYGFYHDKFNPFSDEEYDGEEFLADIQKLKEFDCINLINQIEINPYRPLLELKLQTYHPDYNIRRKIKAFEDSKESAQTTIKNANKWLNFFSQVESMTDKLKSKLHELSNKVLLSREFLSDVIRLNSEEMEIIAKRSDKNQFTLEPMRLG